EIEDATEATRGSEFGVFAGAEAVRFLRVPRELSRSEISALEDFVKEWGAKGLAYLIVGADGEVRSPIAKFLSQAELEALAAGPEATRGSEFGVFAGAEAVRFLRVPRELSRSEISALEDFVKEWGAKGLAYLIVGADGEVRSPIAKFLSQAELEALAAGPETTL